MKNDPIIKEVLLNAPVAKVWKAITDKEDMKQWYFDLAEFKPQVGFKFQFEGGKDEKIYLHLCKVTEVIPNKKLTYSWRYEGYPGISFVTFELFSEGNKTKLKLTHEGLESFGTANPDLARENFVEGWNEIIGASIKKFVENK
ncbi:MAG TPA: SRPBCC domain-containing protein [Ignavibacteriaceae bacterium]|nr:SRPBCC domain-containing protein [Ignavibacteriaceae bacterium]